MSEQVIENIETVNQSLVETNVRFIGDKSTICDVIALLAQIRHAIKEGSPAELKVKIGQHVANTTFLFDVNNQEIADLINQREAFIN